MLEITAVRTIPIRAPLDAPFWSGASVGLDRRPGTHISRAVLLVKVETSDGPVGLGQCVSSGRNLAALDALIREELAASLPNATAVEFDRTGNPLMRELLEEPPAIDSESRVHLPSGPGLGVKLNRAAVEKWRLDR